MSNLAKRLETHFVACAAAAAVGAAFTGTANAGLQYSGPVSIVIPDNIDGLYMNVATGATGSTGAGVAGWDINPYTATAGANSGFHLWGPTTTTWLNLGGIYNLPFGTLIDAGGTYGRPGGGTNLDVQVNLNSSNNYFGFNFINEGAGGGTHYGWIQVAFGAGVGDRSIVGYAYEDVAGAGLGAGVVPAPGSLALLGVGALGMAGRRRR